MINCRKYKTYLDSADHFSLKIVFRLTESRFFNCSMSVAVSLCVVGVNHLQDERNINCGMHYLSTPGRKGFFLACQCFQDEYVLPHPKPLLQKRCYVPVLCYHLIFVIMYRHIASGEGGRNPSPTLFSLSNHSSQIYKKISDCT